MRINKNYFIGAATLLVALGLAGCTNSKSATSTTVSQPTSAKVTHHANKNQSTKASQADHQATASQASVSSVAGNQATSSRPVSKNANQTTIPGGHQVTSPSHASSVPATKASSSQAQALPADQTVLNQFFAASGVKNQAGNSYAVTKQDDGSYQVEIRSTGAHQDQKVANLTGLYHFNPNTNQVQQMDPVSGNFSSTK